MRNILYIICALLVLTSCEEVITVELDEGTEQLVVDAWLSNDSIDQVIKLSMSNQYFAGSIFETVSGADVYVVKTSLFTQQVDTFDFIEGTTPGSYELDYATNSDFVELFGSYDLHVVYQGEQFIANSMPTTPPIFDSLSVIYDDGSQDLLTQAGFYVELHALDPAFDEVMNPLPNIYWLRTSKNDTLIGSQVGDTVLGSVTDLNLTVDGAFAFPSDFDGEEFIPPIRFGINAVNWNHGDTCTVEFWSVTFGAFDFLANAREQITNGSSFGLFATPVANLKSNIENQDTASAITAIGYFNVATSTKRSIVIDSNTAVDINAGL